MNYKLLNFCLCFIATALFFLKAENLQLNSPVIKTMTIFNYI